MWQGCIKCTFQQGGERGGRQRVDESTWCREGERKLVARQHGGMGVGEWERTLQEVQEGGGGRKGCVRAPEHGGLGARGGASRRAGACGGACEQGWKR